MHAGRQSLTLCWLCGVVMTCRQAIEVDGALEIHEGSKSSRQTRGELGIRAHWLHLTVRIRIRRPSKSSRAGSRPSRLRFDIAKSRLSGSTAYGRLSSCLVAKVRNLPSVCWRSGSQAVIADIQHTKKHIASRATETLTCRAARASRLGFHRTGRDIAAQTDKDAHRRSFRCRWRPSRDER